MLVTVASVALGCVFLASGCSKVVQGATRTRGQLAEILDGLSGPGRTVLGATLGPFEVLLGAALVLGAWQAEVATLAVVVLSLFTLVLVRTVLSGRQVPCNCFGDAGKRPVTRATVARNLVLVALGSIVILVPAGSEGAVPLVDKFALVASVALSWLAFSLARAARQTHRALVRTREVYQ